MKKLFILSFLFVALNTSAKEYTTTVENEKDLKEAKIELANEYFAATGKFYFKILTVKKNGKYIITIKTKENDK